MKRGISDATMNDYKLTLNTFYEFLIHEGTPPPFNKLKYKQIRKRYRDTLTPDELDVLIHQDDPDRDTRGGRKFILDTFFMFMAMTGCRLY